MTLRTIDRENLIRLLLLEGSELSQEAIEALRSNRGLQAYNVAPPQSAATLYDVYHFRYVLHSPENPPVDGLAKYLASLKQLEARDVSLTIVQAFEGDFAIVLSDKIDRVVAVARILRKAARK